MHMKIIRVVMAASQPPKIDAIAPPTAPITVQVKVFTSTL